MPQMQLREGTVKGVPAIILSGRLDIDTAPDLRRLLMQHVKTRKRRASSSASRIVLDMSGLEFMDSSGLATLMEAQLRLRQCGGGLILFGLAPQIAEVFSIAQVKGLFTIVETETQAADALP